MGYTEKEWAELAANPEINARLVAEIQGCADKKNVAWRHIDVRWVRGESQFYVKSERHRHEKMNND